MKKNILSFVFLFAVVSLAAAGIQKQKTLLAIFAHPDDEVTVGPVLAKYAAEGIKVYVAVATDGRYGTSAHAKIPGGDSLAATRIDEMKCAAAKLGINPPIMMGMHDQLKMQEGFGPVSEQLNTIRENVIKLFEELKPDVVITWGPSGLTGHHDHRLVGSIVTDVFASKQWGKPSRLYYSELPTGSLPASSLTLGTMDMSYLTVKIPVSEADVQKAKSAWLCHQSQYTPQTVDQLQELIWTTQKGITYFRPFASNGIAQQTLFPK